MDIVAVMVGHLSSHCTRLPLICVHFGSGERVRWLWRWCPINIISLFWYRSSLFLNYSDHFYGWTLNDLILHLLIHLHSLSCCTWVKCFITRWLLVNTVLYWLPILGITPLPQSRHYFFIEGHVSPQFLMCRAWWCWADVPTWSDAHCPGLIGQDISFPFGSMPFHACIYLLIVIVWCVPHSVCYRQGIKSSNISRFNFTNVNS